MTKLVNRAKMTTATTGTGTISLASAVDGYQTFANAGVANADVVRYVIEDGDAWEIGLGTYSSGTLTRGSIESSNADAALNLTGNAVVFVSAAAADLQELVDFADNFVLPTADGSTGQVLTTNGAGTLTFSTITGYTDADVDTHLNTSTATSGEILSWTGSDYDWIAAPAALTGQTDSASPYETSLGFEAGLNSTGSANTFTGYQVGKANTTGYHNVASGYQALLLNTTGNYNIANGTQALYSNTTGNFNTANGSQSLHSNTTGGSNVANGYQSLYSNTAGSGNTANGRQALYLNTVGNYNTTNGIMSMYSNTTGVSNTANGYRALYNNTTANFNVANGSYALYYNNTGTNHVATGYQALLSNTTGGSNVANGCQSLLNNTTGNFNVANGYMSLYSNTTGTNNVATGVNALYYNNTGNYNTATGHAALNYNTTGFQNTANGYQALYYNTTGYKNVANGYQALYSNNTGTNNVADGHQALKNNTTGSGNIGIGFVSGPGFYEPVFDPTTENNRIVMGHASVTDAYIQVAWTVVSDARDKTAFAPVPHGLDFVNAMKPTEYQFKAGGRDGEADGIRRYGFLAQDVLELEGDSPVIVDAEDSDKLKLKESNIIPVLVKAIQELSAEVQTLKAKLEAI
jgi:trimeric autotransporter adhesin